MRSHMMRRPGLRLLSALLALCALCVSLLGCGDRATAHNASLPPPNPILSNIQSLSTPGATTLVGTVPGTQAFFGLVLTSQEARAYICDGAPNRLATLADWLMGQVQNGTLEARSRGGVALRARVTAQTASGTLTLPSGHVFPFTASSVANTSRAGVYAGTARLNGQAYQAGWIVLPSGDQRGAAAYPSGPVRDYPSGPIRGIVIGLLPQWSVSRKALNSNGTMATRGEDRRYRQETRYASRQ